MCLARTDWDVPKHRGLTWFAVPTDAEGVTIRQIRQINGNAEFCEEFLDEVEVTDDDVIGEVNHGWSVTQTMLVYERGAGESGATTREPRALAPDLVDLARRVGRIDDPSLARPSPAPTSTTTPSTTSAGGSPPACGHRPPPTRPSPPTASWPSGVHAPIRARLAMEVGGPTRSPGRGRRRRAAEPAINYLNGRIPPSPRAPTRCSATGSANACSACLASRASTRTSRSTRCWAAPGTGTAASAERSRRTKRGVTTVTRVTDFARGAFRVGSAVTERGGPRCDARAR